MAVRSTLDKSVTIIAVVVAAAAARLAGSVVAPLALALFVIAIVWPLQSALQSRLPALLALAVTILVTVAACVAFASLAVWGFSRVGRSLIRDAARYQALYDTLILWLESHGLSIAGIWSEHFNVQWMLRAGQEITGRLNSTLSLGLITLVYATLGLLEIEPMRARVKGLGDQDMARALLGGCATTATKCRRYMLVRTQMSALTGLFVGLFAWIAGCNLPSNGESSPLR